MRRTTGWTVGLFLCAALFLTSCGGPVNEPKGLKDGVYTGEYEAKGDHPSTMKVTIEIKGEKITKVEAVEYDENGKPKDENYAKGAGDQVYQLAQKAVAGMKTYPTQLLEKQDLTKVDAVSGATVSHKSFQEAVRDALRKAK